MEDDEESSGVDIAEQEEYDEWQVRGKFKLLSMYKFKQHSHLLKKDLLDT